MAHDDSSAQGVLELHPKGFGFLRSPARSYVAQPADPFVPQQLIQKYRLREGDLVRGPTQPNKKGQGPLVQRVEEIEGANPETFTRRKFDAARNGSVTSYSADAGTGCRSGGGGG